MSETQTLKLLIQTTEEIRNFYSILDEWLRIKSDQTIQNGKKVCKSLVISLEVGSLTHLKEKEQLLNELTTYLDKFCQ
jgi:hypothetical protein